VVFPYHLSSYKDLDNLSPPLDDPNLILDDINEWHQYFPNAKPWGKGRQSVHSCAGWLWQTLCQSYEIDGAMVSQEKIWYLAISTSIRETNLGQMVTVFDALNGYRHLKSCYHYHD